MNFSQLVKSFNAAFSGLKIIWRGEQNFRIQVYAAIGVIILMFVFSVGRKDSIILLLLITMVLALEILNSVIERLVDIFKPRLHNYVEAIKDLMAALVLLGSVASAGIGLAVFWPYLF